MVSEREGGGVMFPLDAVRGAAMGEKTTVRAGILGMVVGNGHAAMGAPFREDNGRGGLSPVFSPTDRVADWS